MTVRDLINLLESFPNKDIPVIFHDYIKQADLYLNGISYDGDIVTYKDTTNATFLLRESSV